MQQEDQKHMCKFCYKTFPCGRSLGGHMRSHLINISSPSDHQKSDPKQMKKCKECDQTCKALSGHMKSHSQESWNSVSDHQNNPSETPLCSRKKKKKRSNRAKRYDIIDHQDQQEVALSLILLSMDSIKAESRGPFVQTKRLKRVSDDDSLESEVNSINQFGSETEKPTKFRCVICKKGFPSYQALGGHRASHKKFKGCCAPTNESDQKIEMGIEGKKNKHHECPICFKVFPSGQALGGHKRSHIVADQSKIHKRTPQIRDFLDLNLPAPVEDDFKPWWIATSLLSSS
ncbi:hypothetical protein ACS0TY_034600 [Phlomoides rotata]